MSRYIEKYVYDWVKARERALKARCSFDGKNFSSTDPEAFTELGNAENALYRYVREWLGVDEVAAGGGVEPKPSEASKASFLPQEPAKNPYYQPNKFSRDRTVIQVCMDNRWIAWNWTTQNWDKVPGKLDEHGRVMVPPAGFDPALSA